MSIPRIAIHRPVMMAMLSCIVILLGVISLTRLPVDLLPDVQQPTISVRVNYTGVGPLEMEELVTRPLEQQLSAVSGLEQINSTSQEGSTNIRLSFTWGSDLNEAMDDMRSRIDRVRGRLPEDADPPVLQKFDSNAAPIMSLAVEGNYDRVTLRELAENVLSPRLERVGGVAAVTVNGGLRRQIHVDLSREKITALDLSVDRVVNIIRTENQNIPIGQVYQGDRTLLLRSQGQFESLEDIRSLVVLTKAGVPIYLKDIADVTDSTEDNLSVLRINGRPGVRMQVTKQSGTNTVQVAQGVRNEIDRINREVPGVHLTLLDDSARFIEQAIGAVQEHVMLGSVLVVLVIFLFLRNFRSTLIVCTSIPISVIGTFALLYFAGLTLNTMTFGGLALGVGMVVDAAIVVLENSFRHMEEYHKDRLTASIDGSEEVWSAILASILTHIAVFVPLLFLGGISSVMFKQLSVVVVFSLAMSLFVAVTLVPVLCSKLLVLPPPADKRSGLGGRLYTTSERFLAAMDEGYRKLLHVALSHRPTVIGMAAASVVVAVLILPTIPTELSSQTDEGQVSVSAQLPLGTRIERTDAILNRLEQMIDQLVPEKTSIIVSAGSGGGPGFGPGGGGTNRGQLQILLTPKDNRQRSSDQIAQDLRRQLSGIPGVVVRANASGGNNQLNRFLSGGNNNGGGRLSLEIRGDDLDDARKLADAAKDLMDETPGVADAQVGRDEGRPELALRVDRPKAALLGLSVTGVANTIRTNVAGTQAALYREHGNEYPIVVRLREDERQGVGDVEDVLVSTTQGQVMPAKNLMSVVDSTGPDSDRPQEPAAHHHRQRRSRDDAERGGDGGPGPASAARRPQGLQRGLRLRGRAAGRGVQPAATRADSGARARLRRDGVAVRVAARPVHHHVLGAHGGDRRRDGAQAHGNRLQHAGLHRHHHAGRDRRQQRDPPRRLHERAPPPRRPPAARGRRARRPHPTAADSHDVDRHGARPHSDVARHRRRQRAPGAARAGGHRGAADLAPHHAGARAYGLHRFRGRLEGTLAPRRPVPHGLG